MYIASSCSYRASLACSYSCSYSCSYYVSSVRIPLCVSRVLLLLYCEPLLQPLLQLLLQLRYSCSYYISSVRIPLCISRYGGVLTLLYGETRQAAQPLPSALNCPNTLLQQGEFFCCCCCAQPLFASSSACPAFFDFLKNKKAGLRPGALRLLQCMPSFFCFFLVVFLSLTAAEGLID